jgi:radical SAM-linked protein
MDIFPFRIRFAKYGRMRFLSHHDLIRLFERAIRRTNLPIRMTEGFNPHPRISLPMALGIGIESYDEIMEIELDRWVSPNEIKSRFMAEIPEEIKILDIVPFHRSKKVRIDSVEYEISMPELTFDIDVKIKNFLEQKEFVVRRVLEKETKSVDIRKYVQAVSRNNNKLILRIAVTDCGTARPEEVLDALNIELTSDVRIKKTKTVTIERGN